MKLAAAIAIAALALLTSCSGSSKPHFQQTQALKIKKYASSAAYLNEETQAIITSFDSTVAYDLTSRKVLYELPGRCTEVATHVPSDLLLLGTPVGQIEVRRASDGSLVKNLAAHDAAISALKMAPDGKSVASAAAYRIVNNKQSDGDYDIRITNIESGQEMQVLRGHRAPVADIAFTPDGRRLVSVSNDRTMRLWDIATAKQLECHGKPVEPEYTTIAGQRLVSSSFYKMSVDIAPDGKLALQGSLLWDLDQWQEVRKLGTSGHSAFTRDGTCVLLAVGEGEVCLCDVATGRELQREVMFPNGAGVQCLVISPGGQHALTGGDGTIAGFNALSQGVRASEPIKVRVWKLILN